jgi:elongator complex protein 3
MPKPREEFDYTPYTNEILSIFNDLLAEKKLDTTKYKKIVYRKIKGFKDTLSKAQLIEAYNGLKAENHPLLPTAPALPSKIQMKPMRTQSGVTPVTVLTKPFPCPGTCIFCPNDVRMPKSYLPDEPGAQRATRNHFDPYLQTYDRLRALSKIGHSVNKVELIILGGTWSCYPENYQRWFVKRCFEAMNDFGEGIDQTGSLTYHGLDEENLKRMNDQLEFIGHIIRNNGTDGERTYNQIIADINRENNTINKPFEQAEWTSLNQEHIRNVDGNCKCVGLVIETRPDNISEEEVVRLRKLGCTKIQIGIQSTSDTVLEMNKRGHDVDATRRAFWLLRSMGFKIHGHWMANLYGSSPELDKLDYKNLFSELAFRPDELKIYPCSLLESAELMDYYADGRWKPFERDELVSVIVSVMKDTPEYCRLTRVIRDIPSTDIVVGNKSTNLREVAERQADLEQVERREIRSREIKNEVIHSEDLVLDIVQFETTMSSEYFLQYIRKSDRKIAGFLRLQLPKYSAGQDNSGFKHPFYSELDNCAMIREVHVYGNVVDVGVSEEGRAQHLGLGSKLIEKAKEIANKNGYTQLAVISAIGTREYYSARGFELKELYQIATLTV